jgi:hypothetical protein
MSFFVLIDCFYLAAFFAGEPVFFGADFGFDAFLAAAGFFVAVDLAFFGEAAFLTFGLATFFVDEAFLTPADFVAFFALACFGFAADFVALADLATALVFGLAVLATLTFFGLAAADVADDVVVVGAATAGVAELFVLAADATFLAGLDPADFDLARFFVADEAVLELFFVLVDFFFGFAESFDANLNEPLAPLPFVCLKCFDLIPFLRANLRC